MKKILFFGINYNLESSSTDGYDYHGYSMLSENIISNLVDNYKITLVTDRTNILSHSNLECVNLFNNKPLNDNKNWKKLFGLKDDFKNEFFSRDILLRFNQLVSSIDVNKFNNFLINHIDKYDAVIFNRSEYSFFKNFFKNKQKKILILHDSGKLRRKNYLNFNKK